jgi:hypothetical protein
MGVGSQQTFQQWRWAEMLPAEIDWVVCRRYHLVSPRTVCHAPWFDRRIGLQFGVAIILPNFR